MMFFHSLAYENFYGSWNIIILTWFKIKIIVSVLYYHWSVISFGYLTLIVNQVKKVIVNSDKNNINLLLAKLIKY